MTPGAAPGVPSFPFSAVVGQEDVKLALLLTALDRRTGGVLLRGDKGSAKSTLARGIARLLPGDAPFVELPVSATEDRVVGTLDVGAALREGAARFHPGLLADADGGVLYVDEINLLPDHLVDVLLDVAASGVNRVEREGISESHASRFVLIGSMNPEEGDLRPQLLDRFGLAVDVTASHDPVERVEVVRRRLAFDEDPAAVIGEWTPADRELADRLGHAVPAAVPADLLLRISALCVEVGCQGLRADLVIARAAAAHAGWAGRPVATVEDVRRVAPLALAHRQRRSPLEDGGIDTDEIDRALDGPSEPAGPGDAGQPDEPRVPDRRDASDPPDPGGPADEGPPSPPAEMGPAVAIIPIRGPRAAAPDAASGRRSTVETARGRLVGDRAPEGPVSDLAVGATLRAAARRRAGGGADTAAAAVLPADLRQAVREDRAGNLLVLVVDASASMGVERRMEAVKGAVLSLLLDAYQRRDRVAVVTFAGERARVALRPTGSTEVARARLAELATGGRTPLAAGIDAGISVATAAPSSHRPLLVLVSDGRATAGPPGDDPMAAALAAGRAVRRLGIPALVLDVEDGPTRLGLAAELAAAMGARHLPLPDLSAGTLSSAIRDGALR